MGIIVSHPGVPPHAQQAARAYLEAGLLTRYFTTFVYDPDTVLGKAMRSLYGFAGDPEKQLKRRAVEGIPRGLLATHPAREMLRTLSTKILGPSAQDWIWDWMEREFDRHVAGSDWGASIGAVHGFEYACLETFRAAKRRGVKTVYEMPAPFFRTSDQILEREYAKFPPLRTRPRLDLEARAPRRNLRKEAELEAADYVLCNSGFTRRSVVEAGFPEDRVITIPLGMPRPQRSRPAPNRRPVTFLYAGTLSVRKGIHYLLEAWRRLAPPPEARLNLVGALDVPAAMLEGLPGDVRVLGSVPKQELSLHYLNSDLLLFPTLCDGFGMVLTEALAHGLPVLTTPSAGASDFIQPGRNGFMVDPGDVDGLVEVMSRCLRDPEQLRSMSPACLESAASWQWSDYREALAVAARAKVLSL